MVTLEWRLYEAGYCQHPELATRSGGSLKSCEFPALVALLKHPLHGWILFDTGYSEHFLKATDRFPERLYRMVTPVQITPQHSLAAQLRQDGIAPEDIAWIVLSHLHGDHVGGLSDFPHARVACARDAVEDLRSRSRIDALRLGLLPALIDGVAPEAWTWFEDLPRDKLPAPYGAFNDAYDLFGDGSLRLLALPGHAAGHYGALFNDAQGPVFLIADASWSTQSIRDNTPPPMLVTGWLGNTTQWRQTLANLHNLHTALPDLKIVPSHCREWRPAPRAPL